MGQDSPGSVGLACVGLAPVCSEWLDMYYLRLFFALLWSLFASIGCVLVVLVLPFHPMANRACGRLYACLGQPLMGFKVKAEGHLHLRDSGPCVILANHQSNFDLFVYGGVIPKGTVNVGKRSLIWVPLFGLIYWLGGNVLINRKNRGQAINAMSETERAITQRGRKVWVFPEGTRNHGQGLLPLKKGAFYTAVAAQAPIILLCASNYLQKMKQQGLSAQQVFIKALPAIPTQGLTVEDIPSLMERCQQQMRDTIAELDQRLQQATA